MIVYEVSNTTMIGVPTKGYVEHGSFIAVLGFFEKYLPVFTDNKDSFEIKTEKGLVSHLLTIIENFIFQENNDIGKNYPFKFRNEYLENKKKGNSQSIDIGVISINEEHIIEAINYSNQSAFFSFEAKILGLKSNQKSKLREKEYLIGHIDNKKYTECGGIERFKTGSHGSKLFQSGMIGFVLKNTFDNWFTKINNWIEELIKGENIPQDSKCKNWHETEKLKELPLSKPNERIRKYYSIHSRESEKELVSTQIPLTHFWLNLTKEKI